IDVEESLIDLKDCFLDYEYQTEIKLLNETAYPARFDLMPQDASSLNAFQYTSPRPSGIIEPHSSCSIPLNVQLKRLGVLNSTIMVKIIGSGSTPLLVDIVANGIGPEVSVSRNLVDWNKIPVLSRAVEILTLHNTSPVPAEFTCGTATESKTFDVYPLSSKIAPNDKFDIRITAFLDDIVKFTEILKINIKQSPKVHEVKLMARGQGSTIVFNEGLRNVDFGDVFSNCECVAEYVMTNKGRRSQSITWLREDGRHSSQNVKRDRESLFEVIPQRFTLRPGASQTILIKGVSNEAVKVKEKLLCQTVLEKDPTRKLILESIVSVNFITPLISYNPGTIKFSSAHTSEERGPVLEKQLSMSNTTSLPLTVSIRCPKPFHLKSPISNVCLNPGETMYVDVCYDTSQNVVRVSSKEHSKLLITYKEHPQRDIIDLFAETSFPNLQFSTRGISFGCIPTDVEQRQVFQMTNSSTLPVVYQWYFLEQEEYLDPNIAQVFDVQPLCGVLKPNQTEDVEVYFYGQPGQNFNQKILCDVVGGPKYELDLQGEASKFEFHFDSTVADFGVIPYQTTVEREITLYNDGLVTFDFKVIIFPHSNLYEKIMIFPANGTISPKQSETLTLRFCSIVPERVHDQFYIQIAHNEPIDINVIAEPSFPRLEASLPLLDPNLQSSLADAESDRILLRDQTISNLKSLKPDQMRLLEQDTQKVNYIGSPLVYLKSKFLKKNPPTLDFGKVVHYVYVWDFGTVIKNLSVRKSMFLTNTGNVPVTFSFDKDTLLNTGFGLELEKVKGLPPGEKVELFASFNAKYAAPEQPIALSVSIAGGPVIKVLLKVAVTLPSLNIANDKPVDFGQVLTGYRKTIVTQIQNATNVTCEWYSEDKPTKKYPIYPDFEIIPKSGSLGPMESGTVMIRFTPTEEKTFDFILPIKVQMNPKVYGFHVIGTGIKPTVTFTPNSISSGPVFPFSDGGEYRFTIENMVNYPIEMYAVDSDTQYLEEEEILRTIQNFDEGAIYLPPKDPGASLLDHLLENRVPMNKFSDESQDIVQVGELAELKAKQDNAALENIIVHGPPLSGKTVQAKRIAARFEKVYVHLDELVSQYLKIHPKTEESPETPEDDQVSPELLSDIVKAVIQKHESKGVVLDSLDCKYLQNIPLVLKAVTKAFSDRSRKIIFFVLNTDLAKIKERDANRQKIIDLKELEALKVKELSEDEYDMLSENDKAAYDASMQKYKKRAKEFEERQRNRRHLEEGAQSKQGNRKQEDEKQAAKKAKQHSRQPTVEKSEKPQVKAEAVKGKPKQGGKGAEKAERVDARPEKAQDKDEDVSRLDQESFVNPQTFNRTEQYLSTLESCLAALRDSDKNTKSTQQAPEKKAKAQKAGNNAVTPEAAGQGAVPELEQEEQPVVELTEINATSLDEEQLFKQISDHIPPPPLEEEQNGSGNQDALLEKAYYYPPVRQRNANSKIFSLGLYVEPEEEPKQIADPVPAAVVPQAQPPQKAPVDPKKPVKVASKPTEEKQEFEEEVEKQLPVSYRWSFLPREKKDFVVKFCPVEVGKVETKLRFEIAGQKEQFEISCSGICQYPHLVTDHKKVFAKWRKTKPDKTILHGEYVQATDTYEFGPLLQSKSKEKYAERYIENQATFTMINSGQTEVKLEFSLKNDSRGDVFFFEPPTLDIAPGQSQTVNLWAYPKGSNHFEDLFIVSIKDNPEPFTFKVSCTGVKPDIEMEKKFIAFDKILVGRTDKRELKVKNPTLLSVGWRFNGVEALGDEFSITPIEGLIEPGGEGLILAEFKSQKAATVKKVVRLEVFDGDRIGEVVHDIPIVITSEAYDIAMDVHFPKGFDGGLDFGVLKVSEEGKQICTLKNKGKYEVGFKFMFDTANLNELFVVTPAHGILQPSEKPFAVQVVFRSHTEVAIKDENVLRCIVFEPSTGEVTASIPVKISARSVYSRFSVLPARDLNFGALVHGNKVTRQFVIENMGEFDFKFSIYKTVVKAIERSIQKPKTSAKGKRPVQSPSAAKITAMNNAAQQNPKKDVNAKQADQLQLGPFTVYPTFGSVPANSKLPITVEFHAEVPGFYEELIAVDISERSPQDSDVLEYRLTGESCVPGINTTDLSSIFEDQAVVKRLELFSSQSNVYAEEDRVFFFGAFLAGNQAQVHFKISNPFKVSCDVNLSAKPRGKSKDDRNDFAFDVEPKKLSIPSHEYRYITVSFHPTYIQSYVGLFEAVVENVSEGRNRLLAFELRGDGTLPRISIEKPTIKSKMGLPLLKFRRLLVGMTQTLSIVVKNDGIIPCKFKLEWTAKDSDDFECPLINSYLMLKPQELKNVEIRCKPSSVRKLEAELRVKIADNSFEEYCVQVAGEGYIDDLTFEGLQDDQDNEIVFTDCFVGDSKHLSFKVHNHAQDYVRVQFTDTNEFSFSPSVCHIRPGAEHEIGVHFAPKQVVDIQKQTVPVKGSKIRLLNQALVQEHDWDDKMKVIKWVSPEKGSQGKKTIENLPEPQFETLGNLGEYSLLLSGYADYSTYECETSAINFRSTLMFQTRVFRFPVRNSGKVVIKFNFKITDDEGNVLDPEESPFEVLPSTGSIPAQETQIMIVKFSPRDVDDYKAVLCGEIQNLAKDQKPLIIGLSGSSQRPFCHFELPDSDYIMAERKVNDKGDAPLVLEPNTKVIEFRSLGVKSKNVKKFYIVNPTHLNYTFEWKPDATTDNSFFKCLTPKGLVLSNKKSEVVFEFMPETIDVRESLWQFSIPEHGIRIPFLLVGFSTEPSVYLNTSSLNFKAVLVGRQIKETIYVVNDESNAFSFAFSETSVDLGLDGVPVLKFSPTSGTVAPNAKLAIEVVFTPSSEKTFNFNLTCVVKKKPTPLKVNIKGEGYEIHETLQTELSDGAIIDLAKGIDSENLIDFGQVQINEKRVKRVTIINSGKVNFDFAWKGMKRGGFLCVVPEIGTVARGERLSCEITFTPGSTTSLKNVKLSCHIVNAGVYPLTILGTGVKPMLRFSKSSIEFGPQFIVRPGMTPVTTFIEIHNQDVRDISFDIISNESPWLDVQKGLSTLSPGDSTKIQVSFLPREAILYADTIKFEINGLSNFELPVTGEGSELRIEADQRNVNFGALRIGHTASRVCKLINKSKMPVTFSLGQNAIATLASLGFTFSTTEDLTLRPKGTLNLEIKFSPRRRIPPLTEEIMMETLGMSKPLFLVSGACQGTDVRLENDVVPFGAVVQKSFTTRRIQLQNIGDIGAKFFWDHKRFMPDFTISPTDGYISPGMEIPLEITFHPTELNQDIRYENIPCEIEGMQSIYLTVTGMCVPQPNQTDMIKFASPVRSPDTKSITLSNRTANAWHIQPIIDNEYWKGPETIDVEPGQSKTYDISFVPLETNGLGEGGRHEGSIFFPLPDGTGILYKLIGVADKPMAADTLTREIPCKTAFTEVLPINNWLRRPQRFKVITEFSKPDAGAVIKGHDFIDVPPLHTKDYKFTYYAYKDGPVAFKMIFKNETTQEYLFYNLTYKGLPAGVISTLEIAGVVRQLQTRELTIYNPLSVPVSFNGSTNNSDLTVSHAQSVQPKYLI
ncbi:hypothetical protein EDD86DRAFT_206048, partial [Gorgonomyces haynaldii]